MMNREEFMAQLARLLTDLPDSERMEAIRYYNDYFDEAGEEKEAQVIQELGSPGRVAASIKANVQDQETTVQREDPERHEEETGSYREYTYHSDIPEQNSMFDAQVPRQGRGAGKWTLLIVALVFASPLILGIGGGLIGILAGAIGVIVSIIAAFFSGGIGLLTGGVAVFIQGIVNVFSSPVQGLLGMGGGLLMLACGILFVLAFIWITFSFCPRFFRACVNFVSRIMHKGKGNQES